MNETLTVMSSRLETSLTSLDQKLTAIEAHLSFLDKYANDNYVYFFGDVDNRKGQIGTSRDKSTSHTNSKSTSKIRR